MGNISPFRKAILFLATASHLFFEYAIRFVSSSDFRESLSKDARKECAVMLLGMAVALAVTLFLEVSALQTYLEGLGFLEWSPYLSVALMIDLAALFVGVLFVRTIESDTLDGLWDSPVPEYR